MSSSHAMGAGSGRFVRRALIAILSLLALVIIALLVLTPVANRWAKDYVRDESARWSKQLGRPVQVRDIDLSLLRGRVRVEGLTVGAASDEPQDAPAIALPRAEIDLGLWRTILSLGFRPYVELIELDRPRMHAVKRKDGTLNFQHISKRIPPQKEEPSEASQRRVRGTKIGRVVVKDGALEFVEMAPSQKSASISQIELTMRDVGYRSGLTASLQAALLGQKPNLKLEARVGGLAEDRALPPVERLILRIEPTELAPLAPFLAALSSSRSVLEHGVLSADFALEAVKQQPVPARGELRLSDARMGDGKPFDARIAVDMTLEPDEDRVTVRESSIALADMKLIARGVIRDLDETPRTERLDVRSEGLSFDGLRAVYPSFDQLTEPMKLDGPFALRVQSGGTGAKQAGELVFDLSDASLRLRDQLDKPRGTRLSLHARFEADEKNLSLSPAVLDVAGFQLAVRGSVHKLDSDEPTFALRVETPAPKVSGLLHLLPPVEKALGTRELPGTVDLNAKLQGSTERFTSEGALDIAGLSVNVPGAKFAGNGSAKWQARREPGLGDARFYADLTGLQALYEDVVQKPQGTPLRIDMTWREQGERSRINLDAQLASLTSKSSLALTGEAPKQHFTAQVSLPQFAVKSVLGLLPSLATTELGDIRFGGDLDAKGVVGQPASMRVNVPSFVAHAGRSELRGSLQVQDLTAPRIHVLARASNLDLDDFLPPTRGEAAPKQAAKPKQTSPSLLAKSSGTIDAQVTEGRASGVPYRDLVAKLRIENGRAKAETLQLSAFGGAFSGTGSELPLVRGRGPYRFKGSLRGMELASLFERFAGQSQLLRGALSAGVDLSTEDLTAERIKQTLTGTVEGAVDDAKFLPADGQAALIANLQRAAANIPDLERALTASLEKAHATEGWDLRDLKGALRFDQGAVLIDRPLTAQTPQGELSVQGRVSLSASDLQGVLQLTPEALASLSNGKVKVDRPVPLPLRVQGPLTAPQLSFGNLERVVEPIARAYLEREGERAVRKGLGDLLDRLKPRAEEQPAPPARPREPSTTQR